MKNQFALALLFIAFCLNTVAATPQDIYSAIADDIDGLLWDTVNEGESHALTKRNEKDEPEMKCTVRPSRTEAGKEWYFCTLTFAVTVEPDADPIERECRLSYFIVNGDLNTLDRGNESQFDECIEWLGSSD